MKLSDLNDRIFTKATEVEDALELSGALDKMMDDKAAAKDGGKGGKGKK